MWAPFTEPARRSIALAQEEAERLGNNYIATEHILLGIMSEGESVAAKVLETLGANLAKVRAEVKAIVGRGGQTVHQEMVFTPRAKRAIELAFEEARQLNHNYIGTDHLLVGLIREGEGVAARVLANLGVDLDALRANLHQVAGTAPEAASHPRASKSETSPSAVTEDRAFTASARHALAAAVEETRRLGRSQCGTDHLLFGIAHVETAFAAKVLAASGITPEMIRDRLGKPTEGSVPDEGEIVFCVETIRSLERAFREALGLKHRYISADHLLLGVIGESGHAGADILAGFGAEPARMRRQLLELIAERSS